MVYRSQPPLYYDARMSRADPQFNLRIPEDLKKRVEDSAKKAGRSATAEIIHRLEQSLGDANRVDELVQRVDRLLEELSRSQKLLAAADPKFATAVKGFNDLAGEVYAKRK